ncbi:sulfite exporter TauE/SafE family protein [Cytophaga aurantiaca]|uniref:sulfite exporter TauE/SafE family protein n=1 Tax=Cytophaga aurantiaca TaxID=29530 RepID=UPI0003716901|nr:sulfite exporter TauE/SafE family protein [Cytophaga aurantiaca]
MMLFYAACIMGLTGSLHCLGMCGPIAFALPVRTNVLYIKILKYGLYNIGRVTTYAILGALIGIAGKGFALAGMQQMLSIAAGILIIVSALLAYTSTNNVVMNRIADTIRTRLKSAFHFYFQQKGNTALFMLGLLNGLLPCGMVYMAMLAALAAGSPASGAAFMTGFGLGTVPMMFGVCLAGNVVGMKWKNFIYKAAPLLACMVGVLLILRGMQVSVPLLSAGHDCCSASTCH